MLIQYYSTANIPKKSVTLYLNYYLTMRDLVRNFTFGYFICLCVRHAPHTHVLVLDKLKTYIIKYLQTFIYDVNF